MNILLWALQVLAALLYGASGVMKVFMFDKVSEQVPSFGALPREAWMALGILELVCTAGLTIPAAFHWQPALTVDSPARHSCETPFRRIGARPVVKGPGPRRQPSQTHRLLKRRCAPGGSSPSRKRPT